MIKRAAICLTVFVLLAALILNIGIVTYAFSVGMEWVSCLEEYGCTAGEQHE